MEQYKEYTTFNRNSNLSLRELLKVAVTFFYINFNLICLTETLVCMIYDLLFVWESNA